MELEAWRRLENLVARVVQVGERERAWKRLGEFAGQVMTWRPVLNLTAAASDREMAGIHLFDSLLSCLAAAEYGFDQAMDLGSGAGFPGIPLAICFPERRVVLVESRLKRVVFLERCVRALKLDRVEIVRGRLNELLCEESERRFDLVTARGVGPPPVIWELAEPFLTIQGVMIVNVGPKFQVECEAEQVPGVEMRLFAEQSIVGVRRVVAIGRNGREEKDPVGGGEK